MGVIKRCTYLVVGTFICALGIVMTMKANVGYAPWDVFHWGVGNVINLSIGNVSIVTSIAICAVVVLLGEKLGIGTIVNLVTIGIYIDLLLPMKIIPEMQDFIPGIIMLIVGLFVIAFGSYLYIASGFGTGPRDGLMVACERITKLPVGICRGLIELLVCLIGWFLGGPVGLGTVISALGMGVCVQIVFSLVRFDATAVKHETMDVTIKNLRSNFVKSA